MRGLPKTSCLRKTAQLNLYKDTENRLTSQYPFSGNFLSSCPSHLENREFQRNFAP